MTMSFINTHKSMKIINKKSGEKKQIATNECLMFVIKFLNLEQELKHKKKPKYYYKQ